MLKVVDVRRVQGATDNDLEMGRIKKLYAEINKASNCNDIELKVLSPATKSSNRVPNPDPVRLRIRHISTYRAPHVPHPDNQKQRPWNHMPRKRSHLFQLHKTKARDKLFFYLYHHLWIHSHLHQQIKVVKF